MCWAVPARGHSDAAQACTAVQMLLQDGLAQPEPQPAQHSLLHMPPAQLPLRVLPDDSVQPGPCVLQHKPAKRSSAGITIRLT